LNAGDIALLNNLIYMLDHKGFKSTLLKLIIKIACFLIFEFKLTLVLLFLIENMTTFVEFNILTISSGWIISCSCRTWL